MKNLQGTYVHRGDGFRRRTRVKHSALALSFFSALAFLVGNREPVALDAQAASVTGSNSFRINLSTDRSLTAQLDSTRGELDIMRIQLDRAQKVIAFSSQYGIDAELSGNIVDVSRAEGIDPELAFRLVNLESEFNEHATSPVGAIGLMQVMPSTAREYVRGISTARLYEPKINLRIGLRYLRGLLEDYHGNVNTALLVYNRGPAAVAKSRANGDNPSNGYDRILTKGYRGRGVLD